MRQSSVMPLSHLSQGARADVVSLAGGRHFRERIIGMGLCVGASLQVLRKTGGQCGSAIIATGETRLAIGHGMAEKVMVSIVE